MPNNKNKNSKKVKKTDIVEEKILEKDVAEAEAVEEQEVVESEEIVNSEDKANFYNYVRGLDSLKKSLSGSKDKTLILDKNSELVKILYGN